ncbi:MAG: M48 family metallopeptidase [Clostridia bacterium]|nr:M48 family metallopeptidase [Clostridia bacterium]
MIQRRHYLHKDEDRMVKRLQKAMIIDSKELIEYYKKFEEEPLLPDLIGKTVEINEDQFPRVYTIVKNVAQSLDMVIPKIYTFESFFYDVNAEGLDRPWIKISSKTISDFSDKELEFLIARQMCHIKEDHIRYEVLCEQQSKLIMMASSYGSQAASPIPMGSIGVGEISDVASSKFKLVASQWSRVSEYTADFCAYMVCRDIKAAISAIKKTIVNSSSLADEMKLKSFLKQSDEILKLDSVMSQYSIFDEQIPYGPFRIKELIRFASSSDVKKALRDDTEKYSHI